MCVQAVAKAFIDQPRNLQHPSCWRLIFDGVTLQNGVTVTVVLVCYTSAEGDIEVESFLDVPAAVLEVMLKTQDREFWSF